VEPDIVYIDAGKLKADLDAAYRLFPNAFLCGDDWAWGEEQGYPMQKAVKEFVAEHGYRVEAERQTWVIHRP
jgi:hypothetical protein